MLHIYIYNVLARNVSSTKAAAPIIPNNNNYNCAEKNIYIVYITYQHKNE